MSEYESETGYKVETIHRLQPGMIQRVHPRTKPKWMQEQYDDLGRYKCPQPRSLPCALLVLVPLYLIAWWLL